MEVYSYNLILHVHTEETKISLKIHCSLILVFPVWRILERILFHVTPIKTFIYPLVLSLRLQLWLPAFSSVLLAASVWMLHPPEIDRLYSSGPSCSKLTTSLVNVSWNFQKLISLIWQYFLLKNFEKLLQCKSFCHFFNKKFQCIWL